MTFITNDSKFWGCYIIAQYTDIKNMKTKQNQEQYFNFPANIYFISLLIYFINYISNIVDTLATVEISLEFFETLAIAMLGAILLVLEIQMKFVEEI